MKKFLKDNATLIALVLMMVALAFMSDAFFTARNLSNLTRQVTIIGIIAIGMTGYKDETGKIHHEIGVYYVSKSNLGAGQKVDEYSDFSFLAPKNFDAFIDKVKTLSLTQEEIDKSP